MREWLVLIMENVVVMIDMPARSSGRSMSHAQDLLRIRNACRIACGAVGTIVDTKNDWKTIFTAGRTGLDFAA